MEIIDTTISFPPLTPEEETLAQTLIDLGAYPSEDEPIRRVPMDFIVRCRRSFSCYFPRSEVEHQLTRMLLTALDLAKHLETLLQALEEKHGEGKSKG